VTPRQHPVSELSGWTLVQEGVGWSLYSATPPGVDMAPARARCSVAAR